MARWLIDQAGVQITVRAKAGPARELAKLALSAMQTERIKGSQGIKISLKYDDGVWELRDHESNIERKLELPGDVIYHLTDRIVFHIADKAKKVHCLHAASVCKNGRALVIPANSGAGKSSFTTWLAASGFDYLTDELILIDDQGNLDGIARPIQIKSHGLSAVENLISEPDLVQKGRYANALPVSSIGGSVVDQPQALALFVFPKYDAGSDYAFTRLSSAEAGMRLMANHVNARNLDGHGFRAMMKLIRNTPCYSLNYGGFGELPADFAERLVLLLSA